jgi:hypothetical protein
VEPILHQDDVSVDRRLRELGLSREGLIEVVLAAVTARNSCTENDPSSAPGWMSWKEGSRRLREVFRPDGFIKSNDDGVPWLVDPKNGTRFCVANTDEASGVPGRGPQQRSKKGPATDRAVMRNSAPLFEFSGIEEPSLSKSLTRQPFTTQSWYLCIFAEGETVRAELALPVGMSDGFFDGFLERIVIVGTGDEPFKVRVSLPDAPEDDVFDIPVSRK